MMRVSWLWLLGTGCIWISDGEHQERLAALDRDGDGVMGAAFGGDDCDDDDAQISPLLTERCDTPYDDDCDGLVNGDDDDADGVPLFVDADGDGFGDGESDVVGCPAEGLVADATDCDDDDPDTFPGAPEACPGYGPDRDCSDAARPCALIDGELPVRLSGPGVGRQFAASNQVIVEAADSLLWVWEPDDLVGGKGRGRSVEVPLPDDKSVVGALAVDEANVAVGLQGPGDKAQVWSFDGGDPDGNDKVVESRRSNSRGFGLDVAWVSPDAGPALATLDVLPGDNRDIVYGPAGSELRYDIEGPKGGDFFARSGLAVDDILAVLAPDAATGGVIEFYRADSGASLRLVGGVVGPADEPFAAPVAIADLDEDGGIDLLVGGPDGLRVWHDVLDVAPSSDNVWWRGADGRQVDQIVVADLTSDGVVDVAVGLPAGRGELQFWRGIPGTPAGTDGQVWLTLTGSYEGGRLGSSLGATRARIDGVERDVLLIGSPGEQAIRALPMPSDW